MVGSCFTEGYGLGLRTSRGIPKGGYGTAARHFSRFLCPVTLDAQLAPEDVGRGEDDCEFRSVLPGHYSINRNSLFGVPAPESIHPFVSNRALSVHFPSPRWSERLSSAFRESWTPAVVACSISFSDTAASRGRFRPFSYYPSRGYPVGTGSRAILPTMAPKGRRVR